jgi:hypothetical protein
MVDWRTRLAQAMGARSTPPLAIARAGWLAQRLQDYVDQSPSDHLVVETGAADRH